MSFIAVRRYNDGMWRGLLTLFLVAAAAMAQQNATAAGSGGQSSTRSSSDDSSARQKASLAPPRSGTVSADALDDGASSSKDNTIDLSPPPGDAQAHPQSADILMDAEASEGNSDVREFHPWDPHKAAKDVEVGDFYFKRKNYRAAEDRYREALLYKDNDALATIRLAICLDKMDRPDEALKEYQSYLKILPHGPQAEDATKAIARLKAK